MTETRETQQYPRLGVSAWVVRHQHATPQDEQVLVIERKHGTFAGKISLPGGRVELRETLTGAVKREVKEETGITIGLRDWKTAKPYEYLGEDDWHRVVLLYEGYHYSLRSEDPVGGDDAARAFWITHDELRELNKAGRLAPIFRTMCLDKGILW